MVFGQDVGQVMVVVVGVARLGQGKNLFPDLGRDPTGRRPAPIAMDQPGWAVPAVGVHIVPTSLREKPAQLAERKVELSDGQAGTPTTVDNFGDDEQALLLSNGQGHLLVHRGASPWDEVTFPLNH